MTHDSDELARECRVLTRYLVGHDPTRYVLERYRAAHGALPALTPRDRFEHLLVRLTGSVWTRRPAAAFARLRAPDSALQAKLVTLLAILESTPAAAAAHDQPPSRSPLGLLARLVARGTVALVALALGVVVLTPLRWWLGPRGGSAS